MPLEKEQLRVLTHLIKHPDNWLVSEQYSFIPPFISNPYFSRSDYWCECDCSACKNCGAYVARSIIRPLVKGGLLQSYTYITTPFNAGRNRRVRWILVPKMVEQIPELKELMVQVAIGSM